MRLQTKLIAVFLLLGLLSLMAHARALREWTYSELMDQSDLVVIAQALSKQDTSEKTTYLKSWPDVEFVGVDTLFKIKVVLKGKETEQKITLFHYRIGKMDKGIDNGPMLVDFQVEVIKLPNGGVSQPPDYLLFLKRRNDKRYEPISGHIDPVLSVKELSNLKMHERSTADPIIP